MPSRFAYLFIVVATVAMSLGQKCPAQAPPPAAAPPPVQSAAQLLEESGRVQFTDTEQASLLAEQALSLARTQHDVPLELSALLQAGRMARLHNAYPQALAFANEGLELAKQARNEVLKGKFYLLIGFVQWNLANLPAAFSNLLLAEKISRTEANIPLQIGVQSVLGLVEARNDDPAAALPRLEAALALAKETHDPQLASTLNNLGTHYLGRKDYARARAYYEEALPMARAAGDERLIAFLLVNLGRIATETNVESAARQFLAEALATAERFKIRRAAADVYYLSGALERQLGHYDASRDSLERSLALARELKNPDLFASIYTELVATEEASGHYREALNYAQQLSEQKEIIRGEKSRLQLAQLTAQYDAEARGKQIKILQRDRELDQADLALKNTEISRARSRYSAVALGLVLVGLGASAFAGRQRVRARHASAALEATRAAKQQVEEADATKARLLTIAAQNLQESEARFRNAFELSPLGMALVGLDGRWLRVNPAICRITGYTEGELLETDFQRVTHPDDLTTDLEHVATLLRGESETYQLEKRYIHKNGLPIWTRLDVSLIREPDTGEPKSFVAQVQDITARRHDEELLHQAKEEAERANTAKSEFLSRMSHELRTPLNAILGFGQLLEIQDLGTRANQSVGQILTASRHLLELINEVLDISTIESGQFALSPEATVVSEVVRGVIGLVRPLAEQANIHVTTILGGGNDQILADQRRLKQILLNLLSNAIKYNREGGTVSVTCSTLEDRVRIEIADTGMGMDPADLESIFVPFSRLMPTQGIPGTGLGLSLSKALIEVMHGTLEVKSELGKGSTFAVEFDRLTPAHMDQPAALGLDAIRRGFLEPAVSSGATLLYIEDNAANLELVQLVLTGDANVRLLCASDGLTGLLLAAEHRPDLILLDMHLPDMDGSEVLRLLRSGSVRSEAPVIIISADVSHEQMTRMEALGINEYLKKPFELNDLRRAVNQALQTAAVAT